MLIRSRFWKKVAQHDRIIEDVLYTAVDAESFGAVVLNQFEC